MATDAMPDSKYTPSADSGLVLRLYVAGDAPNSTLARANLRRLLDSLRPDQYQLEVIDCLNEPMRAIADGVLVTPTLLRVNPQPTTTLVGSLSSTDKVAKTLQLPGADGNATPHSALSTEH